MKNIFSRFSLVEWLIVVAISAILVSVILGVRENRKWNEWAKTHCKKIGESAATVDSGGHVTPGQTGWQCDDGITYWR